MQNLGMGYDPRAIANALLDIGDRHGQHVSNLTLNKIIYFIHSDSIAEQRKILSSLTFEAWQYGPVLPIIYHQFKGFGGNPISGQRATKLCAKTGASVEVDYDDLRPELPYIEEKFLRYSRLSPSNLINLSHITGGPWHLVWNGAVENAGMKITNNLILQYTQGSTSTEKTDSHGRFH